MLLFLGIEQTLTMFKVFHLKTGHMLLEIE